MVDSQENRRKDSAAEISCPQCGAPVASGMAVCWLCFSPLDANLDRAKREPITAAPTTKGLPATPTGGFSLASMLMLVTLVSVVLGVFTISPGFGVPLAIVATITWVRTVSVVKYRSDTGAPMTFTEIILIFLRSVALVFVILMLVGVAAVSALAALCSGLIGASGPKDPDLITIFVVSIVVLVAAVLGIVVASRFERRRWRRDHHDPK